MTDSHSFKRIKIFLAVVIFAFLSILLWNVCFNRHSMTGVVIENKNQLKIEATEKDFVDSHGKYFVIRFEKGKENRNDDFLVGDQVIVKYDGIIYESNPAVIDAKSVKRKGAVALTISAQPLFLCKKLQPGFEKSGCWCKI